MKKWNCVITCYNYAHYIEKAVKSVLNQNHDSAVITIVNDCSKDNSYEICEEIRQKHPEVNVIHNEQNMGVSYSRNIGVAYEKTSYVLILDADDEIGSDFLKISEEHFSSGYDIVIPKIFIRNHDMHQYFWFNPSEDGPITYSSICSRNPLPVTSPYRYELWQKVNGYKTRSLYEDHDFWMSVFWHDPKVVQSEMVFYLTYHPNSRCRSVDYKEGRVEKRKLLEFHKEEMKKYFGFKIFY